MGRQALGKCVSVRTWHFIHAPEMPHPLATYHPALSPVENSVRTAVEPKAKDKEEPKQKARSTVALAEQFIRLFEVGGLSKCCLSVRKSIRTPSRPSRQDLRRSWRTHRRISAVSIATRPPLVLSPNLQSVNTSLPSPQHPELVTISSRSPVFFYVVKHFHLFFVALHSFCVLGD